MKSAAQIRMPLTLVRVATMHHNINAIEPAFEEVLIGLKFELIRYNTSRIREHAVLGDNGITFDATGMRHCNHFPTGRKSGWVGNQIAICAHLHKRAIFS